VEIGHNIKTSRLSAGDATAEGIDW
jgi:hypothetical protein